MLPPQNFKVCKPCLSMVCAAVLLCCLAVPTVWGAGEPSAYEKAKVELSRLRGDDKRAQYRHEWLRVTDDFMDVYDSNSSWANRGAALFRAAEALEEMARRSFNPKDAQAAALRFEEVAAKHAKSVLADDALYRAAVIRKELLRDQADSRALLEKVLKKYPGGDYAPKAEAYLARLNGDSVASLGGGAGSLEKTKSNAVATRVSQITPQLRKNVVRIVISLDRHVSWNVEHLPADTKYDRPARLVVDLLGASPDKGLKAGARYSKMGILRRYAVDYTASNGQTRILLDFNKLAKYTVKLEKSPFRLVVEATAEPKALASGIRVGQPVAKAEAKKESRPSKSSTSSKSSRASAPANVAAQLGLSVRTVIIDAGHGGKDPGAIHNNIVEREICLDLAKRLGTVLNASGYKVVYTRDRDTWVSLSERSRIAMEKKGDLFISIHVNASTSNDMSGVETYYLDLAGTREAVRLAAVENAGSGRHLGDMENILADLLLDARIQESRRLASTVQDSVLARLKKSGHSPKNGGTKGAPFHVLLGASMPGILVEVGYCSNTAEAKKLRQSKYRDALAEGMANGVHHYAKQLETAGK